MDNLVAVLTGDLIGSTRVGSLAVDRAMTVLAAAAGRVSGWAGADTHFTRYRGDGWQLYLDFPGLGLRASVLLTASLKASRTGLASRISVGLGPVDRLGAQGLADASGEAFTVSGQNLDAMPRGTRLMIGGRDYVTPWHEAIYDLVDWQSARWTPEQAEAVVLAIDPAAPTQAEMAAELHITRQALQARLSGAGLSAMMGAFSAFEGADLSQGRQP